MGVNYSQYCIYGIEIARRDYERVVADPLYEEQNRYNPKTGEITHKEKVLVSDKQVQYQYDDVEAGDWYDFKELLREKFQNLDYVETCYDEDSQAIYFGFEVGEKEDLGRVDLINGYVSLNGLKSYDAELREKIPDGVFKLYFCTDVG